MSSHPPKPRGSAWMMSAVLALVAIGVCILLTEAALRWIPVLTPHGTFGATRFDPAVGLNVHDAPLIYNKVRYVRRVPNRAGFLDVAHQEDKPSGTVRVGFFGDSYVEAAQVKLEDTFFRLIPQTIGGKPVETFGFGISGWGTLHALMNYRVQGKRYDLDLVVYLFVKNDPGDNSAAFAIAEHLPTARLSEDGMSYRMTGGHSDAARASLRYRAGKWIQRHSRLAQVVKSRLSLVGRTPHDETAPAGILDPNDVPSAWPPAVRADAERVTARILSDFHASVLRDGRDFVVLYVPRDEGEIDGGLAADDTWLPWLSATCDSLGIPLIDPGDALRTGAAGAPMYDDHWSPAGHRVIAVLLTRWLEEYIRTGE